MKVGVLKALANPARIFFVPYNLAVLNFIVLLFIYLAIFVSGLIFTNGKLAVNPLYFLLILIAAHSMLAMISKKEPFLLHIIMAKLSLFRKRIPGRLVA